MTGSTAAALGAGAARIAALLRADPARWNRLTLLREVAGAEAWIGAGFVRDAVWDHLHGRPVSPGRGDVDVIWHDPACPDAASDRDLENRLRRADPVTRWSVKNQARMHVRNGDEPYESLEQALAAWPETATAVAMRAVAGDACQVLAPLGLADLFGLVLRPGPAFAGGRRPEFDRRVEAKQWLELWPLLRIVAT